MGQKKIKLVDLSEQEDQDKKSTKGRKGKKEQSSSGKKIVKSGKAHGKIANMEAPVLTEDKEEKVSQKGKKEKKKARKKKLRSKRYKEIKLKVDQEKLYPLTEAVSLLIELANSKIDETVEVHLSTHKDKLTGTVNFPHGTGKKQKVVIATDDLIDKVKKGKIDFDILVASPQMMPKIAQVAKVLGPKGLMPNPKAGTISDKPEELKKKMAGGETKFKTEPKAPLLHQIIGKISFGEKKLLENLEALIKAVGTNNIKKGVLTSTHSPGIKLNL